MMDSMAEKNASGPPEVKSELEENISLVGRCQTEVREASTRSSWETMRALHQDVRAPKHPKETRNSAGLRLLRTAKQPD
jgi:hypothetical protein